MADPQERVANALQRKLDEAPLSIREWFNAQELAAAAVAELGLQEVWTNDVAGPGWMRYRHYETPKESFPGPNHPDRRIMSADAPGDGG